jgi:hypothetical protein
MHHRMPSMILAWFALAATALYRGEHCTPFDPFAFTSSRANQSWR